MEDGLVLLGATITFTRNFQPVLILIIVDEGLVLVVGNKFDKEM